MQNVDDKPAVQAFRPGLNLKNCKVGTESHCVSGPPITLESDEPVGNDFTPADIAGSESRGRWTEAKAGHEGTSLSFVVWTAISKRQIIIACRRKHVVVQTGDCRL